ncbi:hypothetical protein Vafri_12553 [Volvox africanus]|uniref:Myb-like domain-containing protein n=1 Tax=Volvox africanus TaxID=51714 RepID=A0A8J4BEZ7_9CHLO|nr:hypothetical protein Vafri_12553 [Volvox africanus]
MDIYPGPAAAATSETLGCRTSGRLRSRPREYWRNEERDKPTTSHALDLPDPEVRSRRGRESMSSPSPCKTSGLSRLGSLAMPSLQVLIRQAAIETHAGSLHQRHESAGAATSTPARLDVRAGNAHGCRAQAVAQREHPVVSEGSPRRRLWAQKLQPGTLPGALPGKFRAGDTAVAAMLAPSVQTTRTKAPDAAAAADQMATNTLPQAVRQADALVANLHGKPVRRRVDHQAMKDAPAVAGAAPATITAAKTAESGAAEVQSAVARGDAAKVLAAGTPVVKLCKRKARADPVLRSAILVRDVAAAVGQVAWPGSASDQDTIGVRRSRRAASHQEAHVGKQQVEEPCTAGSKPRTRPASRIALQDRVLPVASLRQKSQSKLGSKATGMPGGKCSAAAAGTRQPKRQQQLPPGPSLPAAQELEQDVDEEEAYRPRKRARKATVQQPGSSDGRERMTAGVAGHESERGTESTLYTRVCTQPAAATVAEDSRQQAAKVGAAAEDESAARGQKKRGRKPTKASAVEAGIAAQPTSQPEPNIPSQQAAPVGAAGRTEEAGPGKAPGEALGAAPVQLQQTSALSVMPSAVDGSPDCKAAGCAETPLQAAERIAPQVETPVQHQEEEQPVNQAGDQHIQLHQVREPHDGHRPSLIVDNDRVELWRASAEATREKQLTHDNGGGTSQEPGTAGAAEVADRSGGTGNRQEPGRTAEDIGPNAAAGPSQPTRRVPPSPGVDADTTLSSLDLHEADGGPPCRHARPHAVMHAEHDLQPRSGPSAPALGPAPLLFSKVQSIRRALQLEGELKKLTLKWRQAIVDREEDGWTPDQVRDLQVAYYNTDPTLPNFWREVAKGVRGRTAAECFNRVFGSAQEREDRALFAKVLRRHNPAPAAGGGAGRLLDLAAARKRSQKAHEQELLQFIACMECVDAESKPDDKNGFHAGGSCAREPAGDKCRMAVKEPWEHCVHGKEPTRANNCGNEAGPAVNEDWQEDDMYDEYSTEDLEEDEDQE